MNVVLSVLGAWLGSSLALLIVMLCAKPSEPDFYDLTEDQTR